MANSNLITQVIAAHDAMLRDVWEFSALIKHLDQPDNPPPLVLVLAAYAQRLSASADALDTLSIQLLRESRDGGMGAVAPMVTKVVDSQSNPSRT